MRGRRGMTLGMVLAVVTLAMVVVFSSVGTTFIHLGTSQQETLRTEAREVAHSVVSLACSRLLASLRESATLGADRSPADTVRLASRDGIVTFDLDEAHRLGIPWSTNNLAGAAPADGSTRQVPARGIHLVGVGTVGNQRAAVEAILHVPPFPYAIACSGPIECADGNLIVGGLRDGQDLPLDPSGGIDVAKLAPGHIMSNSMLQAVDIGPRSKVTGDVRARGSIKLAADVSVLGEVRAGVDPAEIPAVDLADFDPEASEERFVSALDERMEGETTTLSGFSRYRGTDHDGRPLVVDGSLRLDGAVLYVDGGLVVKGGLEGKGALFVTGAAAVEKGARITSDNELALVAGGDVTLTGTGRDRSAFQGLVYAGGDFRAEQITLLGSFVANKQGASTDIGSHMRLKNATLIQTPGAADMTVDVKVPAPPADDPVDPFMGQVATGGTELYNPGADISKSFSITPQLSADGRRRCYDRKTDTFRLPKDFGARDIEFQCTYTGPPLAQGGDTTYDGGTRSTGSQKGVTITATCADALAIRNRFGIGFVMGPAPSTGLYHVESVLDRLVDQARVDLPPRIKAVSQQYDVEKSRRPKVPGGEQLHIDLNRFVQPESTVRVLLWREM